MSTAIWPSASVHDAPPGSVAVTSATTNWVLGNACRQPSHSPSSWLSSPFWLSVATTGACTVSLRDTAVPSGAVAVAVISKSTSAGSDGALAVGDAVGVELALRLVEGVAVGFPPDGVQAATVSASVAATTAAGSTDRRMRSTLAAVPED